MRAALLLQSRERIGHGAIEGTPTSWYVLGKIRTGDQFFQGCVQRIRRHRFYTNKRSRLYMFVHLALFTLEPLITQDKGQNSFVVKKRVYEVTG